MRKPIFNALEFDGINSLDYGIYITGEAVYNAPERDVERVEVAGRNGEVIIDNGRWKNIEMTYHCGCFGKDKDEFAKKIREFRTALASRIGYKRLVDTYNLDEYRLGAFISPLEVDAVSYKRAGEFDITFNCKPQRWLLSGESAVAVTSGESLYNPTPYDASPLLAVKGYGTIVFNGYEVEIDNGYFGDVTLLRTHSIPVSLNVNTSLFNFGDEITILPFDINWNVGMASTFFPTGRLTSYALGDGSGNGTTKYVSGLNTRTLNFTTTFNGATFASDSSQIFTYQTDVSGTITSANEPYFYPPVNIEVSVEYIYDETFGTGKFKVTLSLTRTSTTSQTADASNPKWNGATVYSTKTYLGDPTYIDCDLGDAYKVEDGELVSLNSYIDLGSDLPTLASGQNEITYDNTITELKITPRWWIL